MPTEQKRGYALSLGIVLLIVVALIAWFGYNSSSLAIIVDQQLREQFQWTLCQHSQTHKLRPSHEHQS
jgi:hypothetical protein